MSLDDIFPAMPILHKYNFKSLLQQPELIVGEAWAKRTKKTKHTFGEWLWLAEELQLKGLHDALVRLLQGFKQDRYDTSRLFEIGKEVNAVAARAKKPPSPFALVMTEVERLGVPSLVLQGLASRSKK
eukprot:gene7450-590_t